MTRVPDDPTITPPPDDDVTPEGDGEGDAELAADTRAALARWQPAGPPPGFADRMMALQAVAPSRPRPQRARWPLVVAGLAAAAVLAMFVWPVRAPRDLAVATRSYAARESVSLGGRGVAVVEAGTTLGWRRDGTGLAVHQASGDVFYRVDRAGGAPFVVATPAGDVRVTGTCFRVEVLPMKPSRSSVIGAAVGAVISTAAVITVYEGKVLVASPSGQAEVEAGERVTLDGTAPTPQPQGPGPGPSIALELPSEPGATITRDQLLVRDQAQRQQIAALSTRLKDLEGVMAGGGKVLEGPGPGGLKEDWMNPTKEELLALAKQCGVKLDIPPVMRGGAMQISPERAEAAGLTPEERATANQVFVDLAKSWNARVRSYYVEATGDAAGADQLSAHAMGEELTDKATPGEPAAVQKRISHERAGLVAPPADLTRLSPYERFYRGLAGLGDEAERLLAAKLGAEKAHKLRAAEGGWPMRWAMNGCSDEDSAADEAE